MIRNTLSQLNWGLILVIVFLLAFWGVVGYVVAANAAGVPMMHRITPNDKADQVLARLISDALEKDPKGTAVIDGSVCTTPQHFLRAIREYHPGAQVRNVQELPTYVRSLQRRSAPEGTFRMSRMLYEERGDAEQCRLDQKGWTREFSDGEFAWYDTNLGKPVLAGDCANVVGDRIGGARDTGRIAQGPCYGRNLLVRVWQFEKLPSDLQEKVTRLVKKQETRDSFWSKSVSRTLGREIRESMAVTAQVNATLSVQHVITKDGNVRIEHQKSGRSLDLAYGMGHTRFPESVTTENHALRIIVPYILDGWRVLSPTVFGRTGVREIRLYGKEWKDHCSMNVHIIVHKPNEEDS